MGKAGLDGWIYQWERSPRDSLRFCEIHEWLLSRPSVHGWAMIRQSHYGISAWVPV